NRTGLRSRARRFESAHRLPEVFTFDLYLCSRLGSDILPVLCWVRLPGRAWPSVGLLGVLVAGAGWAGACGGAWWRLVGGERAGGVGATPAVFGVGCRLGRGAGGGLAASAFPGFRREPGRGPPGGLGLAGVPGGGDALVADGEQAGEPEHEGCQAHEPGPA